MPDALTCNPILKGGDSGLPVVSVPLRGTGFGRESSASCFFAWCRRRSGLTYAPQAVTAESGGLLHVPSSVDVPIVDGATGGTGPLADIERFGSVPASADQAGLGSRFEPADLDQGAAVPGRLAFEHADEFRPARVVDGLGHLRARKGLDRQVFHADRLVLADQAGGELLPPTDAARWAWRHTRPGRTGGALRPERPSSLRQSARAYPLRDQRRPSIIRNPDT